MLPPSASKIETSFSRHCLRTNLQGFGPICLTTRLRTLHHVCHEVQEEDVVERQSVAAEDRKHLQDKDPLVVGAERQPLWCISAHKNIRVPVISESRIIRQESCTCGSSMFDGLCQDESGGDSPRIAVSPCFVPGTKTCSDLE